MQAAPSILEALDHPDVFGPFFAGNTWQAWRAFLGALFGLPLPDDAASLYAACTGRSITPAAPFTEAVLCVGRRGGKSRALAAVAVYLAVFRDYTPHLAPGEVATIAILAANRAQARSIFRYVSGLLKAVPALAALIEDDTGEAITLSNRVVIEITTASFRTARGYSFAAVLCDEIAFWRQDESSANPDVEILRALRPGMATIPGSILLLASSPYAKRGELYAAFRRHYGKDDARVLVWKADTATMNPAVDPAIIAEAYESDPEAARAEYGGDFRDDLADFVTREVVDAVTCIGRNELPPVRGVDYYAFCDPSGGVRDAMTLAIGHLTADAIGVVDCILEVRPPFDPAHAVESCVAALRRYGVERVVADRYAGQWPAARFRECGIDFEQSARAKSDLYADLLPLLNARRVELLDHPRLAAQLVGLERRTARSGRDSIDHSPGAHDDIANVVAGLLVGLDLDRRPTLVRRADLLADGKPVEPPGRPEIVFAVAVIDHLGRVALVTFARNQWESPPLVVLGFVVEPLSRDLFVELRATLDRLAAELRPFRAAPHVLTASALLEENARLAGLRAHLADPPDAATMSLGAAAHVAAGRVKIAPAVAAKARTSPFGASIELRAGALDDDDPLRAAMILGVHAALDKWRKAA